MKTYLAWLATATLFLGAALTHVVAGDAIAITSEKKLTEPGKFDVGHGTKGHETFNYTLKFENQTLSDISGLKVDYAIFIQRPKLGAPVTDPGPVDKITGSGNIEVLTNRTPQTMSTNPFTLNRSNIRAGYYYEHGGRMKAEDSVVGVWVQVTQGDKLVAEYAEPPTVKSHGWNLTPNNTPAPRGKTSSQ